MSSSGAALVHPRNPLPSPIARSPIARSPGLVAGTLLSAVWIVKQLLEPLAERFGVAIEP
jgi:hypothetical protein